MTLPVWRSELLVRLRSAFFLGGAVETSAALPPTVTIVFGKAF
jgi:hypothetical protein